MTLTHRHLRLEWCRARWHWTATEWSQVIFSDESGFNFSSVDNHVSVWSPLGERLSPTIDLLQHTVPTADVMVWGAIAYDTRSRLILIHSTMTARRNIQDILQLHVLLLMAGLPGAIFQQENARSHKQGYHKTAFATLPRFPSLFDTHI
ncbi:transposable element Tcb2 transposase [Trichonephila clavipes]|uniref:Transposable element Tcb2 transposase n=1 Tax=Trichonephila clavipes TaxID=2585209 RepID=A0A8X6SW23_TRICX|nr:transposable element Tcb2 transposase [Trichonephila clavipes]